MTYQSAVDELAAALAAHGQEPPAFVSDLTNLLEPHPERMRHWQIGEGNLNPATILDTWSGDPATDSSWVDLFARRPPTDAQTAEFYAIIPDASTFMDAAADIEPPLAQITTSYQHVRTLIAPPLPPEVESQLADYFEAGADARLHHSLPLFICFDSEHRVVMSTDQADNRTSHLLLAYSPLIAGIAKDLFTRLWTTAQSLPHRKHRHEWSALLQLLYQGDTLDSAARHLNCTLRSARRRLDAAYAHYGVSSLFELGAAWGANVATPTPITQTPGWTA